MKAVWRFMCVEALKRLRVVKAVWRFMCVEALKRLRVVKAVWRVMCVEVTSMWMIWLCVYLYLVCTCKPNSYPYHYYLLICRLHMPVAKLMSLPLY